MGVKRNNQTLITFNRHVEADTTDYILQSPGTPSSSFPRAWRWLKAGQENWEMPSMCLRPSPSAWQCPAKGYGQESRVGRDCPRKKARNRAGEQKNFPVDPKLNIWALKQRDQLWFRRLAGIQIPSCRESLIQPSKHLKSVVNQRCN